MQAAQRAAVGGHGRWGRRGAGRRRRRRFDPLEGRPGADEDLPQFFAVRGERATGKSAERAATTAPDGAGREDGAAGLGRQSARPVAASRHAACRPAAAYAVARHPHVDDGTGKQRVPGEPSANQKARTRKPSAPSASTNAPRREPLRAFDLLRLRRVAYRSTARPAVARAEIERRQHRQPGSIVAAVARTAAGRMAHR